MYIEKSALLKAIEAVNDVTGTQRIVRTVEVTLVRRLADGEPFVLPSDHTSHDFDARGQFHSDVRLIAEMLEADGTLYSARSRHFIDRPNRIARELVDSGVAFATVTKVKEARKLLRLIA